MRSRGHHVPAGEHARAAGHHRRRDLHGAIRTELDTGHRAEEAGVGLLTDSHDHRVRGQRLEPPGRPWASVLIELHHLDLQLRSVERGDGSQPVDPHALALGVLRLFLVCRHLPPGTPVDDHGVVGTEAACHPGGVEGGVAAAVHRHPPADHRTFARGDAPQEGHRVDDRTGIAGRDVHPLGQVGADRDEHGVEVPLDALGGQVLHRVITGQNDTQRGDPSQLGVEHVARQPVGGNAVPHHPARPGARVADLDVMAEPCQVVGGRQPARARRRRSEPAVRSGTVGGSKAQPCSTARSPRNRSTEWIDTALSRSLRLQTLSHGW